MKKVTALVFSFFVTVLGMQAAGEATNDNYSNFYNGSSYIFVEGGVEFSVFPDGQFDFVYLGNRGASNVNVSINSPNVSINYNSGYNYDAFVQYDDYGAVIQIEDVPVYYDQFGRIAQAGSVEIRYVNRRIVRVGGLRVYYNPYGYFSYCTGFVSPFYTTYIYRPWHVYYARPFYNHCVVYDYPYRQYYHPHRYAYSYHRTHYNRGRSNYNNGRRDFYRPGSRIHYKNGRTAVNREYNPNRKNTMISSRGESRGNTAKVDRTSARTNKTTRQNSTASQNSRPMSQERKKATNSNARRPKTTNSSRPKVNSNSMAMSRPKMKTTTRSTNKKVWQGRPMATQAKATKRSSRSYQKSSSVKRSSPQRNTAVNKRSTRSNRKATSSSGSNKKRGRG